MILLCYAGARVVNKVFCGKSKVAGGSVFHILRASLARIYSDNC